MYKIGGMDYTLCSICEREEETMYNLIWQYFKKIGHFKFDFWIYCNSKIIAFEIVDQRFIFGGVLDIQD